MHSTSFQCGEEINKFDGKAFSRMLGMLCVKAYDLIKSFLPRMLPPACV